VDESATGSVNSWSDTGLALHRFGARPSSCQAIVFGMHLRMPSIDRGVQSFLWALLFFVVMYFGMVALDVHKGTALIVSLVSSFLIFLFVRTRG
jgi:hypothetical protein